MTARQGTEEGFIQQNFLRRLERSQTILIAIEIEAVLYADRGIYIAHQRGRHFDVRYAAAIGTCDKCDHVGQYAAANGNDRLISPMNREGIQFTHEGEIILCSLVFLAAW